MKGFKRISTCMTMLFSVAGLCGGCTPKDETFVPIVRFMVWSDIHVHVGDTNQQQKMSEMIDFAYSYADSSESGYTSLDAIFSAGDMVNRGSLAEYQECKSYFDSCNIRENTKVSGILGNHDFMDSAEPEARYEQAFGETCDFSYQINGITFIGLSSSTSKLFSQAKKQFLQDEIDKANRETPNKPIILITHFAKYATVYGTLGYTWGTDQLQDITDNYPNIVNFAGHSHFTISDPRSIHQGTNTTVNTGSMYYYELGINGGPDAGIKPSDYLGNYSTSANTDISAAEMWIVEINEHNDMRLLGYNHNKKGFVVERILKDVTKTKNFTSFEQLAEKEPVPEFPAGSEIKLQSCTMSSLVIEFPKAVSEGYIESYRVRLTLDGKDETFFYHLGCQYFANEPETHKITLSNLRSKKDYKVEVFAVNAFNQVCENPLVSTLSTR